MTSHHTQHRPSHAIAFHARSASLRSGSGHSTLRSRRPRGFTLTEMLVATALTLIILLIFAQVFRAATRTISTQRGIGQNDARARMINTIVRSDLQKATFRDHPGSTSRGLLTLGLHDVNTLGFEPIHRNQAGYWCISENDPLNDTDDVLQFTVSVDEKERNKDDHPFVGRAAKIGRPAGAASGTGTFNPDYTAGRYDLNQPEFDDGDSPSDQIIPLDPVQNTKTNGATQSRFAEVCYFLRAGTLYRRVMLVRDPVSTSPPGFDSQPQYFDTAAGRWVSLLPGNYDNNADIDVNSTPGLNDFWNDFDCCAIHDGSQVLLLGKNDLRNAGTALGQRLSDPGNRFGFQFRPAADPLRYRDLTQPRSGCSPIEYVDAGNSFVGRLTHQETSSPAFSWPAFSANNPYLQTDLTLSNGVVQNPPLTTPYNGPRRGEDIVLTNVDAFDIKLFDPLVASGVYPFVDVGGSSAVAFGAAYRADPSNGTGPYPYDSRMTVSNHFDTWHPKNAVYGHPPYRPLTQIPPDPTTVPPLVRGSWRPDTAYNVGDRVFPFTVDNYGNDRFPGVANVDDDSSGTVDDETEFLTSGSDDYVDYYDGLFYEVVDKADPAAQSASAGQEPVFLKRYGHRVVDNGLLWKCFDNRIGASIIQITIRYRDPDSNLSRQVTIQHSLTDRSE
ncbi:MAG: type II secretion system protein J [Planctomycetaceae bacterium]